MGIRVAIGFRVRTGRATAVVVQRAESGIEVLDRQQLTLSDPDVPESLQPYHAGLERSGAAAAAAVERGCSAARKATGRAVRTLLREQEHASRRVVAVGLVVGSDGDPASIGNPHVRAHASEGRLFREAVESAATRGGGPALVLVERDLWDQAALALGLTPGDLKRMATGFGREFGAPWRVHEKTAAVAAWLALVG